MHDDYNNYFQIYKRPKKQLFNKTIKNKLY